MKSPPGQLAAFLLLLAPLAAHECWLQPSTFFPAPGQEFRLQLKVGMNLEGETRPLAPKRVAALRHFSARGAEDLTGRARDEEALAFTFDAPGGHVLAYDSVPNLITLGPAEFADYLREEGLDNVLAERTRRGETDRPGRERYLRCNKTLIRVGEAAGDAWPARTGQALELVPLDPPSAARAGQTLRFTLLLRGQPLTGAKVRAWHRAGGQITTLDAETSATGEVAFTLPAAGMWMLSTVHMARLDGDRDADWESHWANLTFALAP